MAQSLCAVIKGAPKVKLMAQMVRHWVFPHGALMAQWRTAVGSHPPRHNINAR
jgi:hypothetical protein